MQHPYDFESLKKILAQDGRLIRLHSKGKAVFVGDTHGDFEATEAVFKRYLKPGYILVFLGDYVDRGDLSRKNLEFLLKMKSEAPEKVFLLMGNHEAYPVLPFSPADFWESLSKEEEQSFSEICQNLSFAAVTENGLLALHGVPPDVDSLEEINEIQIGSEHWQQATWGDFLDMQGGFLGYFKGRPVHGDDYFKRKMNQFRKNVLIRAHQPYIETIMFDRNCLTLITSFAYKPVRIIAIADLEKPSIETVDDLEILEI